MATAILLLLFPVQERRYDPNKWLGCMDRVCFSHFVGRQCETWLDYLYPSPDRREPPPQAEVVPVQIDVMVVFSPAAVEAGYQGMLPGLMARYHHVHQITKVTFNVVAEVRLRPNATLISGADGPEPPPLTTPTGMSFGWPKASWIPSVNGEPMSIYDAGR